MSRILVSISGGTQQHLGDELQSRLEQSLIYFYPLRDRPDPSIPPEDAPLSIQTFSLSLSSSSFDDIEKLKAAVSGSVPA